MAALNGQLLRLRCRRWGRRWGSHVHVQDGFSNGRIKFLGAFDEQFERVHALRISAKERAAAVQ
jgi:hypothetical protein